MTIQTQIVLISILTGFVAAGFVWYGWSACENVLALLARRRQNAAPAPDQQDANAGKPAQRP